jgi:enoyl-[acyl-carrier protein] reductase I
MIQLCDLRGKKGLVVGIANEHSIAYGCAKVLRSCGAELAVTYLNAKAEPYVRPLAVGLNAPLILPCDVQEREQLEAVFERVRDQWGKLDFLVHSIAYAPLQDLHARLVDCSVEGFKMAMDISCHSFIKMAQLSEPLMQGGGCLITVTFYGSKRVVKHYNLMGPVKAALESAVRYLAAELAGRDIRVHAISPGPLRTRAASGISDFEELVEKAALEAPQKKLITIEDIGNLCAFLVSDAAQRMTGTVIPVDAGLHVLA